MAEKVDIFPMLKNIDDFNLNSIKELTEEEKKSLSPYLLLQWMNGCKSKLQIQQLNATLNRLLFEVPTSHKELLFKIAYAASDGRTKKYYWIKKKQKQKKYTESIKIIQKRYHCSKKTALSYIPLLEFDGVYELALELGEQQDTIKKIKKELQ